MKFRGVVTGDMIASSAIQVEWREQLLQATRKIADELRAVSDLQIEFFRGDSFQLLVEKPEKALTVAVLLRAGLMRRTPSGSGRLWDARLAIGVGAVDFLSDSIVVSDGEAFRFSGREMDAIKKKKLAVRTRWDEVNEELAVSTAFADDVISGWTQAQAEVVYLSLLRKVTQREIASQIDKSPQTVSKLLGLAKESLVRSYLERCERLIAKKTEPCIR